MRQEPPFVDARHGPTLMLSEVPPPNHEDPSGVFDMTVDLDGIPDGYRAMHEREALKVLVKA